jgi:hypothetical protein
VFSSRGEDTVTQDQDGTGERNPDHHLWRNGRLWWVAFTVHLPGWQKERVRLSLGTDDIQQARRLRDELLRRYPETRACALSLRIEPPRRRTPSAPGAQPQPQLRSNSQVVAPRHTHVSSVTRTGPGACMVSRAPW